MYKKLKIAAMIPARMGSTRLPAKNLAILNGKPLIYYAVKTAKDAGIFDDIIINAEDDVFGKIARRYKIEFYKRPRKLASSKAKSDQVVYDFMKHIPCDIVVWVNTIAPLQNAPEVRRAVEYFVDNELDSLITVRDEQVHCSHKGKPVNFKDTGLFAQTQDLTPVQLFVYSLMMWRTETFMKAFEKDGYAFFCGRRGLYPVSKLSSVIIKREEDLMFAECIARAGANGRYRVRYDRVTAGGRGIKR